jgi:hypothetical protein
MLILVSLATSVVARAQDQAKEPKKESAPPRLGMAPGEPQTRSAPPSVPFGVSPATTKGMVLDFHGYLQMPFVAGIHRREDPQAGQSKTALHSPPLVPDDVRRFEWTGAIPGPWVQLNLTYGNQIVAATAILAGRSAVDAAGIYNPVDQLGVNDAFLNVKLTKTFGIPLEVKVGAMTGRYGAMGMYDAGRYGTPLIAQTNSIGEAITAGLKLGDGYLVLEQALGGQLSRPPRGIVPAGWNDFADTEVGASFVSHWHAGLSWADLVQVGLHYLTAWSQDDQGYVGLVPDGRISVYGGDLRFTTGPFGHLYLGVARTQATNSGSVSGVIEVLNARGGPELIDEYLGPNSGGDGGLTTFGAQYDLSVARSMYGDLYRGESSDILVSVFGIGTRVNSKDPDYDKKFRLKVGAELTYNMLSWFGFSGRVDHVREFDVNDDKKAFNVISPRVLFHTDWRSRDEVALQYSHFIYGSEVPITRGYQRTRDNFINPDRHVVALTGTFWW